MQTQLSPHPRGVLVSFCDDFAPRETKDYIYKELPKKVQTINTRVAYIGSECVRDIVNEYDPIRYQMPYCLENEAFRLSYRLGSESNSPHGGIYSVYSKIHEAELWSAPHKDACFFSPIYEYTPYSAQSNPYEERRLLGRNIRGLHAVVDIGRLQDVRILEEGEVFHKVELVYALAGTQFCSVIIKMFQQLPRIDFSLRCAKTIRDVPESLYLPLSLSPPSPNNKQGTCYIDKGGVPFRPGIDQIPGTCMEYYLSDQGLLFRGDSGASLAIHCPDAPMLYMGELKHHPISLCDGREEYNRRPLYSWVMNNIWE
ncbi:MAG: hypothetical protein AAF975_09765, partial [Spirochaetota bacterium]